MRLLYLLSSIVWLSATLVLAQPVPSPRPIQYFVEAGALVNSGLQTPYWLRTNQYGTVPLRGQFGTLRVGMSRDYRPRPDSAAKRKSRFDWGFGLNAIANVGPSPTGDNPAVMLPDAYVKLKFGRLELFGGDRREVYGLGDTTLTSGFIAWSGNALPFPKIQTAHAQLRADWWFCQKTHCFPGRLRPRLVRQ